VELDLASFFILISNIHPDRKDNLWNRYDDVRAVILGCRDIFTGGRHDSKLYCIWNGINPAEITSIVAVKSVYLMEGLY
jgi:hypothetical protein